jgi:hypothetical protein
MALAMTATESVVDYITRSQHLEQQYRRKAQASAGRLPDFSDVFFAYLFVNGMQGRSDVAPAVLLAMGQDLSYDQLIVFLRNQPASHLRPVAVAAPPLIAAGVHAMRTNGQQPKAPRTPAPASEASITSRPAGVCGHCKQGGHTYRTCPTITCHNCGATGHIRPDCTRPAATINAICLTSIAVTSTSFASYLPALAPAVVSRVGGGGERRKRSSCCW